MFPSRNGNVVHVPPLYSLALVLVASAALPGIALQGPSAASAAETAVQAKETRQGLMAKAEAAGSVRVIATLDVPFRDPATLSEGELANQTAKLHQAQDGVIERVLGGDRDGVSTFDLVPYLALSVTPDQLARLLEDPAVKSVQEDAVAMPSAPQTAQ